MTRAASPSCCSSRACSLLTGCTSLERHRRQGVRHRATARSTRARRLRARGSRSSSTGEDLDGEPLDLADYRGKPVVIVVWGAWCAPCRAEAPDVVGAAEELGDDAQFVGHQPARLRARADAQAFVRTFDVPYPLVLLARRQGDARVPRASSPPTPSRRSSCSTRRAGSPRRIIGELPSPQHPGRADSTTSPTRREGPRMGEWFSTTAGSGSLAARHPGRAGRRARLVLLAVRDPAAAGLPLLRHRPVGRRPRGRRGAAGCWPARCCSCSASPSVFVALGTLSGALGALADHVAARDHRSCSASSRSCSGWSSPGSSRGCSATCGSTSVPAVGLGAAPLLGAALRPRLDAVHRARPSAVIAHPVDQRGHRRARRAAVGLLRPGPRAAVRRRRARLPPDARRVRRASAATSSR